MDRCGCHAEDEDQGVVVILFDLAWAFHKVQSRGVCHWEMNFCFPQKIFTVPCGTLEQHRRRQFEGVPSCIANDQCERSRSKVLELADENRGA